ncbi:MAG: hypothetical protein RML36_16320 [Anaerolineae bacterium]|nr:hypothetical protein [Anaerolineae bacterium]MDW8101040.1 hypothetical protein [Anaerolineae bacterium]
MATRWGFHERTIVGLASLVIIATLLIGCQTSVQIKQRAQPKQDPEAIAAPQAMEHNLSLLAVDFDPPLDQLELAMGQGVVLMVAIQNNGQDIERGVPIIARLYDVERGGARAALLVESVTYLDEIGPGEIGIARFDRLTSLPIRSRYFLTIEIAGVPGEFTLADNVQRFEIVVRPMPSAGGIRSE